MSRRDIMLVETDILPLMYRPAGTEYAGKYLHSVPDGTGAGCEAHIFYQHCVPDGTPENCYSLFISHP
jgi:hypothetical protein